MRSIERMLEPSANALIATICLSVLSTFAMSITVLHKRIGCQVFLCYNFSDMKPALVSAIVLAFAIHLTPRCEAKEKSADVAKRADGQQPSAFTAVLAFATHADQQSSAPHNEAAQNQSPSGDETAQWILIVITGVTAGFICWQAWETRKAAQATQRSAETVGGQTEILRQSVSAANAQIRMMKDKERARLRVVFPPKKPELPSSDISIFTTVKISVFNDGQTWAFNVTGWGSMGVAEAKKAILSKSRSVISLPKVIRKASPDDAMESEFYQTLSSEDTDAVESGGAYFFAYGEIRYEDVFGEPHCTPFRFCWSVYNNPIEDVPYWEDQSPPST